MNKVSKRPQVIQDLIGLATYIAEDNLDASDLFLQATEETFKQLGKIPQMGKLSQFFNQNLAGIRQQAIKGFRKYLIFYRSTDEGIEILRVIHGVRDLEAILDLDLEEEE